MMASTIVALCSFAALSSALPEKGDSFNSILELVKPYPLENHYITTDDGYILSAYRIPHGLQQEASKHPPDSQLTRQLMTAAAGRKVLRPEAKGVSPNTTSGHSNTELDGTVKTHKPQVVYLQHGLLDSCAGFLLAGHDSALAFLLADAGFDVWLGNSRGSTYSRAHVSLPLSSQKFWKFSFDEMAVFDLPATLSYIRKHTGADKIHYVGHSQGTTILMAALSPTSATKALHADLDAGAAASRDNDGSTVASLALSKTVADSLGLVVLMAPVATARYVNSMPLQAMSAVGTDALFALLGIHEFLPSVEISSWLYGGLCTVRPELCVSILAAICGYRRRAVNETRLPLYLQYTPAGTSVHNMAHWAQALRGGKSPSHPEFSLFDYGDDCGPWAIQGTCNQKMYGMLDPPTYRLGKIPSSVRLALFTGGADMLASPKDTELLLNSLPSENVVSHFHLPDYEHLDFIWAMDATKRVYYNILNMLLKEQ